MKRALPREGPFFYSAQFSVVIIAKGPTTVETLEGMSDKSVFGADGTVGATSRVLMSDGKAYPAYYIFKDSTTFGITFTELTGYSASDIVRLEVPKGVTSTGTSAMKIANGYTALKTVVFPEGFTTLGEYTFMATATAPSALVSVSLPSTLQTIGQRAFTYCNSLEELIIPEGITEIPIEMANYTTSLKTVKFPSTIKKIGQQAFRSSNLSDGIVIPEGCTEIVKYAFRDCSAIYVELPSTLETVGEYAFAENEALTTLYSKAPMIGDYMFKDCLNLEFVTLENTKVIKKQAFNMASPNIAKISELVLPEGLTTVGEYAFVRLSITELVTPSTLTTVDKNAFSYCKSLKKLTVLGPTIGASMFADGGNVLEEVVLTNRLTSVGSGAFNNVRKDKFTTYFAGTAEEAATFKTNFGSVIDRFTKAVYCSYEDYTDNNYTPNSSNYLFIYDCNVCEVAFDGNHPAQKDDGNCNTAVMCSVCKTYECVPAKEHVNGERLAYTDLMAEGEYYFGCTNDGCTVGTITKANALFIHVGYSAEEDDGYGIVRKFMFDNDAIAKYIELVDSDFEYGMVVAIANNSPLQIGEDGKTEPANTGVVSANFTNGNYTNLQVKIANIAEEAKGISIVNTLYVRVDNEFYYANGETMAKTAEGKSYNDFNPQA